MMGLLWIASSLLQLTGFVTLTLITGVTYKVKFAKKKDPGLQKPDWKKDVYLCQFLSRSFCQNYFSTLALKLETWLRISGISMKTCLAEAIPSQDRIDPLQQAQWRAVQRLQPDHEMLQKFEAGDGHLELGAEEEAMTRAATGMVERASQPRLVFITDTGHMEDFVKTLRIGEYYGSEKTVRMWARVQPYITRLRSYMCQG